MQRLALALAVTAITVCCGSATRAQVYPVGPTVCQLLPSWYPRGWELMVRYPCVTYVYGSSYYPAAYSPIRESTRIGECQLMPCSGSIAGHICVPAGGGEISPLSAFGRASDAG